MLECADTDMGGVALYIGTRETRGCEPRIAELACIGDNLEPSFNNTPVLSGKRNEGAMNLAGYTGKSPPGEESFNSARIGH